MIQFEGDEAFPEGPFEFPNFSNETFDAGAFRAFVRDLFDRKELRFEDDYIDAPSSTSFKLKQQQKFAPRYLNFNNNLKGLLLFHYMGSGKTCSAILVGEAFRIFHKRATDRKIIAALPSATIQQFREELSGEMERCIREIRFEGKKVSYRGRPQGPPRVQRNIVRGNTESTLTAYEEQRRQTRLRRVSMKQQLQVDNRVNLAWDILSHQRFINGLVHYADEETLQPLAKQLQKGGNLVIIDEVQNLISESGVLYKKLITMIRLFGKNNRFLLLSATPLYDKPFELGLTMNLMEPRVTFPSTQREFNRLFVKDGKMVNQGLFKWMTFGYVSYFSGGNPLNFPYKRIIRVKHDMAPFQEDGYVKALEKEARKFSAMKLRDPDLDKEENMQVTFFTRTRETSNVYFGETDKTKESLMTEFRYNIEREGRDVEVLNAYSSKMAGVLRILLNTPYETSFIFSDLYWYGVRAMAEALSLFGYKELRADRIAKLPVSGTVEYFKRTVDWTQSPHFVLWSGKIDARYKEAFARNVLAIVNHPENSDGRYINVVLGTRSIMEGISFKNVRNVHILNPWWNASRIEQVIARAVRSNSHLDLPPEKRYVNVYMHETVYTKYPRDNTKQIAEILRKTTSNTKEIEKRIQALVKTGLANKTIDTYIMQRSEKKKALSREFETALKQAAVDCELYRNGNLVRLEEHLDVIFYSFGRDLYNVYYVNPSTGDMFLKFVNGKKLDRVSGVPDVVTRDDPGDTIAFVKAKKEYATGKAKALYVYTTVEPEERLVGVNSNYIMRENIDCSLTFKQSKLSRADNARLKDLIRTTRNYAVKGPLIANVVFSGRFARSDIEKKGLIECIKTAVEKNPRLKASLRKLVKKGKKDERESVVENILIQSVPGYTKKLFRAVFEGDDPPEGSDANVVKEARQVAGDFIQLDMGVLKTLESKLSKIHPE